MALPHFHTLPNNNSEDIYNMVVELYEMVKTQSTNYTLKKKLISTKGKLVWEDGEEYLFESEDGKTKFVSSFITVYIEPENYTDKLEKFIDPRINKLKGIKNVEIIPYLKVLLRQAKINNILKY